MPIRKRAGLMYTTLRPAIIRGLSKAIADGHPFRTACAGCGVALRTFYHWRASAMVLAADKPEGREYNAAELLLLHLLHEIEKAEYSFVKKSLLALKRAGRKEWTAHAWLLERRFPDEFGRRNRIEIGAADDNSDVRTPAELAAAMDAATVGGEIRDGGGGPDGGAVA